MRFSEKLWLAVGAFRVFSGAAVPLTVGLVCMSSAILHGQSAPLCRADQLEPFYTNGECGSGQCLAIYDLRNVSPHSCLLPQITMVRELNKHGVVISEKPFRGQQELLLAPGGFGEYGTQSLNASMYPKARSGPFGISVANLAGQATSQNARPTMTGTSPAKPAPDWDYDGDRILGHIGAILYVWDAHDGRLLNTFTGHQEAIMTAQFSPDGKYALSSSWLPGGDFPVESKDTSTRLWDLRTGQQILHLDGQVRGTFSPDGKRLLTYSVPDSEGSTLAMAMWEVPSGRKLFVARASAGDPYYGQSVFSPDGRLFAYLSLPGTLQMYDSQDGHELWSFNGVDGFHFYAGRHEVATFGSAGILLISTTGQLEQRIAELPAGLWRQKEAWTPDGQKIIASGWEDAKYTVCGVRVWSLKTRKVISVFKCGMNSSVPLVDPNGKEFLVHPAKMLPDGSAQDMPWLLCSLESPDPCRTVENTGTANAGQPGPQVLGFSPDGKTFLMVLPTSGAMDFEPDGVLHMTFSVRDAESGGVVRMFKLSNIAKSVHAHSDEPSSPSNSSAVDWSKVFTTTQDPKDLLRALQAIEEPIGQPTAKKLDATYEQSLGPWLEFYAALDNVESAMREAKMPMFSPQGPQPANVMDVKQQIAYENALLLNEDARRYWEKRNELVGVRQQADMFFWKWAGGTLNGDPAIWNTVQLEALTADCSPARVKWLSEVLQANNESTPPNDDFVADEKPMKRLSPVGFPQYASFAEADPDVTHNVRVRVPMRMRIMRKPGASIARANLANFETVTLKVGRGMFTGIEINQIKEEPGKASETLSSEFNASMEFNDNLGQDIPIPNDGQEVKLLIKLFETDSPPQHLWMPSPYEKKYRVLWSKEFLVVQLPNRGGPSQ